MSQATYTIDYDPSGEVVGQGLDARANAIASCNSGGSTPSNPIEGMLFWNTSNYSLQLYSNGKWLILFSMNMAGAVQYFAKSTVPVGWLECDGTAVSRTTYANLFAAIGTTFGIGDGTTTFNLPDLRGEFIRGWDHGRGVDPTSGRTLGSYEADALQNITGTLSSSADRGGFGGANTGVFGQPYGNSSLSSGINFNTKRYVDFDASLVARTSTETRPRNIALMPCIKY